MGFYHVVEGGGLDVYVSDGYVVAGGWGHVRTLLWGVELCPWVDYEEAATLALDVFYKDVLIVLGGIGAHLEP